MVSKKFVAVFFVDLIFLWFASSAATTQNSTDLYDAVSLGDIWQPPTPPQDHDTYYLSPGPHLRKRI